MTTIIIFELSIFIFLLFIIVISNNFNKEYIEYFINIGSEHKSLEQWSIENNRIDILDKKLCEFYINSSHNSYLSGMQITGNIKSENILNILNSGARCIELDIHSKKETIEGKFSILNWISSITSLDIGDNTPIVTHGTNKIKDFSYTNLEDILITIRDNAFKNTNDPLLIYLELFNLDQYNYAEKIQTLINKYLGKYLYEGTLDKIYNNFDYYKNNMCLKIPIKILLNKIIIFVGRYNTNSIDNLYKFICPVSHAFSNDFDKGIYNTESYALSYGMSSTDPLHKKPINQLARIYPNNIIKSTNYNPEPFWNMNYNIVSLNFSTNDLNLKQNTQKFKYCSFIPIGFTLSNSGKLLISDKILYSDNTEFYSNISFLNSSIEINKCYYNNTYWYSTNNSYYLKMQSDGNLVIYNKNNKVIWDSNTSGNNNSILCMQTDGNLVIYNSNNKAIWNSGSYNIPGSYARLDNDGKLRIYKSNGSVLKTIN